MANYDNNFNDELRQRLSIVDVVSKRVPLTKKGKDYWGCCPFHNEKTPSFKVSEEMGRYYCFGCGEKGDIISFIMKTQNMGYLDAIKELANLAGIKLPDYKPKTPEQQAREISYFGIMELAAKTFSEKLYDESGRAALEYVRGRGFTDEVIKKYRIGFAPKGNLLSSKFANQKEANIIATGLVRHGDYGLHDFFRDRLMFPIFNIHGQIVAFSGRSMDGSEPKYINTSDTELFHKRQTIFGLNFARDAIYKGNRSILVEGQIDAIQMQTHGFEETVAPLGTALTEDHLQILCKSNRNITFCFDGDTAGKKAAARACGLIMPFLRDNSDVRFAFVVGGKDPDDILKKSDGQILMKSIIDSSMSLVDFLWTLANQNFVVSTPGGRTQAEKFLDSAVAKITDLKLREEFKHEYDERKFNHWHKWKKTKDSVKTPMPEINSIETKMLADIAVLYPDLIEKHSDFLLKTELAFNKNSAKARKIQKDVAEKFIVSLKIKHYLKTLQSEKQKLLSAAMAGNPHDTDRIKQIDQEIEKTMQKLNLLQED